MAPRARDEVFAATMRLARFVAIAVLVLAASGCHRSRSTSSDMGPFEAKMSETGGDFDTLDGAVESEVNPARPVSPIGPSGVQRAAGAASADSVVGRGGKPRYEARLEEVELPVEARGAPTLEADARSGGAPLVNAVLAEINGEVITREDILGSLRSQVERWREELPEAEFDRQCRYTITLKLREAVSRTLVLQEAERNLSEAEKKQIDATLGQILKELAAQTGSMLLLEEKLKVEHSTVEKEMRRQREQMLVQRFLREKIAPMVHVTHSQLLDRYRAAREERYVKSTRARLGLIEIRTSEFPDRAQAEALAQAVHERARAGEDFGRLAERYSHGVRADEGGDWGWVTQGAFRVAAVDEALFACEAGEVAPLVSTDGAFYIVRAAEREDGRAVPFVEVQDELEQEIRDEEYNRTVSKYIQDLYGRAYVRIFTENF